MIIYKILKSFTSQKVVCFRSGLFVTFFSEILCVQVFQGFKTFVLEPLHISITVCGFTQIILLTLSNYVINTKKYVKVLKADKVKLNFVVSSRKITLHFKTMVTFGK